MIIKKRKRAIVLITTLIFLVILLMIVSAALLLSGSTRDASGSLQNSQAALLAAETGLDYARTRLQDRPNWKGDGDGIVTNQTVVRSPDDDLIVVEDNGSVVGYMTTESGIHSQFRIRFNFHDGNVGTPDDADQLDDPATMLPGPYVSYNNLGESSILEGKRAEESGSVWEVTDGTPSTYDVPPFAAYLIVEGYAGNSLRDQLQDPDNPNPLAGVGGARISKRVLDANLRRSFAAGTDGVIYANGGVTGTVGSGGEFSVQTADPGSPPRIRSNENVEIEAASGSATYLTDSTGEVYVKGGASPGTFTVDGVAGTPGAIQDSTTGGDFFGVEWEEVRKAGTGDPQIRAGTYIWRRDDGTGTPFMEYYQEEYDPANTYAPGAGLLQIRSSNPDALLLSGTMGTDADVNFATYKTEFMNNILVSPQGGVQGVAIVPESDVINIDKSRPLVQFTDNGSGDTPVLTSPGQVYVSGEIGGTGSVTAVGDITFQGSSALEVAPDQSVAVYSQNDVILKAIPDPVVASGGSVTAAVAASLSSGSGSSTSGPTTGGPGSGTGAAVSAAASGGGPPPAGYQDQAFAGIIFAGGDFNADLRTGTAYPGNFYLRGLLTAYGGDPADENPGGNGIGEGKVGMDAENAYFTFDPAYIDNLVDLTAPTPLVRSSYGILE
jgi:type II secretory pathway pseudopilin PulG